MTKVELVQALATVPDDAEILIEAWPDTGDERADLAALPRHGELYAVGQAEIVPTGEGNSVFFTLKPTPNLRPDHPTENVQPKPDSCAPTRLADAVASHSRRIGPRAT
jgi:hypothetical protein